MAKRKKLTLEQQWEKEVKRIEKFITPKIKAGFRFPGNFLKPTKELTQGRVNFLKTVKADYLYNYGQFVDPLTGEIMSRKKGKYLTQKRAKKEGLTYTQYIETFTTRSLSVDDIEQVLRTLSERLNQYLPSSAWYEIRNINNRDILVSIIESIIDSVGAEAVVRNVLENSVEINKKIDWILFAPSDATDPEIEVNMSYVIEMIQGRPVSLMDNARFTEYAEENAW